MTGAFTKTQSRESETACGLGLSTDGMPRKNCQGDNPLARIGQNIQLDDLSRDLVELGKLKNLTDGGEEVVCRWAADLRLWRRLIA